MLVRLWLVVLMAELLTVVAFKPLEANLTRDGPSSKPMNVVPHDFDHIVPVTKSRTKFHILIPQDSDRNLSVTVTPSCNSMLNWDLKFIPLTRFNQTVVILWNNNKSSDIGRLLIEYTGVSIPVTYEHGRANRGLYVISAQTATGDDSKAMFHVGLKQKSQNKQFGFRPNGIKIKKGGQKIYLRWNLSHIDHHLMKYSLVISSSKIYSTICEAEHRLGEKLKTNLTYYEDDLRPDDRLEIHHLEHSTSYTMTDLIYDETYYFTVFVFHDSHIATHHANATYKFQKSKPIGLKDARPRMINLRAQNGKASFRYKVGNNRQLEKDVPPNTLYWYVMPCDGVVYVEIRCRKKLLISKRVFGYEKFIINNTMSGERYVLKVESVSVDETQRIRSIEVMATVRPTMIPMPDMPNDLRIQQYVGPDDCKSVKIGWLSANSLTDLKYCVYVQENNNSLDSVDFSVKPDQCKVRYGKSRRSDVSNNYRTKTRCYIGEKGIVLVEKILKLKPSTTYTIQVTVTKPRGRTLSYDFLKLDTNSCGLN
ncbi:protein NDNF-like [Myzus persicae]|uniref:protein NDNF-like n=1 Tax=Myzus persicae TaxID=13164 RepID=UPI000B9375D3|nr:protein NDNF-like [Myzus persicae]XP_022176310.1 protein NDNF-like [Myzus persicae]XP_022176311.1 protein NDNF-like [Myzus persicae]